MKISITLEEAQWNALLAVIGEMPFRMAAPVAPIVVEIVNQGKAATAPKDDPPKDEKSA